MTRKPSFVSLRSHAARASPAAAATPAEAKSSAGRQDRKQTAGFLMLEMVLATHMLARQQGRGLQALIAQAFNNVLRKHDGTPVRI